MAETILWRYQGRPQIRADHQLSIVRSDVHAPGLELKPILRRPDRKRAPPSQNQFREVAVSPM
jgi:hypothetical protein